MAMSPDLEKALAELAYAIAFVDDILEEEERLAFESILKEEMLEDSTGIRNYFLMLRERESPNVEQAYRQAMFSIKSNREAFSDDIKEKYLKVLARIADSVEGLREEERKLIRRFERDVDLI